MFQSPRKAKRLYFDVIPKAVDEYLTFLSKISGQSEAEQIANPIWHIHSGDVPAKSSPVSFALLLNLVSASNADNKDNLWGYIQNYAPGVSAQTDPLLDRLTDYAVAYYHNFVKPNKKFRAASDTEVATMKDLIQRLKGLAADADPETIQTEVYAAGKEAFGDNLRAWFQALYEVLLGQSQGPRFGSFTALYGIDATIELIESGIRGDLIAT